MIDEILLFTLLALGAEILGTISGFGSSVLFVPIASFFFDFHSVLGITALFHVFSNVSKILLFRKGIEWAVVLRIGIPAVIFVSLGAFLSKLIDASRLESFLAVFMILFSLVFLIFKSVTLRPATGNMLIGGSLSGLLAGLVGTGGAIRGMLLSAFRMEKEIFIATSALIDFGVDLSRSAVYAVNGYVHWHDLPVILVLLFVSIVGTYLGKKILKIISEENFRIIVLLMILGIGIFTAVRQFM
jgi:uncharacterized membrane protein YfcA